LYKHWFVDFEFPNEKGEPYKSSGGEMVESELGLIPKGWEVKILENIFTFERGVEPGSKNYKLEADNHTVPFFRVGDLDTKTNVFVNKDLVKSKFVNEKDVLVSFDGAVGRIGIGFVGAYSSGLRKVLSKDNLINNSVIYFIMKSNLIQETMAAHANGTTILHASSSIPFLKMQYNFNVVKKFDHLISPIFQKLIQLKKESIRLAALRDLLLPKLMSGEIEVPVEE
jgi:type I restriction enzyme S subunit